MQQQYHKLNILRPTLSDCAQFHRNKNSQTFGHHHNQTNENFIPCPNTLVLPSLPSVVHSDTRGHITSPKIYALQPQSQKSQVKQTTREIKNASNFERTESFITGGNPEIAVLWHEINSFDFEAFVESIESNYHNNVVTKASNNVQQIHASPQDNDGHVSDEFADNFKPSIKEECHHALSSPITYAQNELSPPQNPSHPDTSSSDSSQSLHASNDSNRSISAPSPSTSSRSPKCKYKCTVPCCLERFKNGQLLISHLQKRHGHHGKYVLDHKMKKRKAKVQCKKCQNFFVSKWGLNKHLCYENVKHEEWLICEYCQKSYVTDGERKKHYASDHSDKIKELWERQYSNNVNTNGGKECVLRSIN